MRVQGSQRPAESALVEEPLHWTLQGCGTNPLLLSVTVLHSKGSYWLAAGLVLA